MNDETDLWAESIAFGTAHRHTFVNNESHAQRTEWLERILTRAKALGIACVSRSIEHNGAPAYQFGFSDPEDRKLFHRMIQSDLDPAPSGRDRYSHVYNFSGMTFEHQECVRLAAAEHLNALGIRHRITPHGNGFTAQFDEFADKWLFENMAAQRIFEESALELLRKRSLGQDRHFGLD